MALIKGKITLLKIDEFNFNSMDINFWPMYSFKKEIFSPTCAELWNGVVEISLIRENGTTAFRKKLSRIQIYFLCCGLECEKFINKGCLTSHTFGSPFCRSLIELGADVWSWEEITIHQG